MILRTSALWACLLIASASVAQQKSYTVKKGDTPERIARKAGVSAKSIRQANPGLKEERLQIGQKIIIRYSPKPARITKKAPQKAQAIAKAAPKNSPKKIVKTSGIGSYSVRNGDHDENICLKFGISAHQLRAMNPGVNWERLQIGQKLRVPGTTRVASKAGKPQTVAKFTKNRAFKFGPTHIHKVAEGENDWIIARKGGITVAQLHRVNPKVNWAKLQLNQKINIPGGHKAGGPAYAVIPTNRAVVNASNVYVRSKPTTASSDLRKVDAGAVGKILDREKGWYKLKFASGSTGWVKGSLLKPVKATSYVASNRTINRQSYSRKSYAKNVESAPVRSVRPSIVRSSGTYVSSRPLSSTSLIDKAYGYLGVRYHYGGTSRAGIDCSGFARAVYSTQGIKLPRTSIEQSHVGKAVGQSELRQGDLVFFRTRGGSRVSHVGVYIGNGKFIHASSGKGQVTTSSLSDGYYSRRYAGARRISGKLSKSGKSDEDDRRAMAKAERELKSSNDVDPQPEKKSNLGTDEPTK